MNNQQGNSSTADLGAQPLGQQQASQQLMGMPGTKIVPKTKGPDWNDRDAANDCLLTEKYLTQGYNIAAFEASHRELQQLCMSLLNGAHESQYMLYEKMYSVGWYKHEVADGQMVAKVAQQFTNYTTQQPTH